MAESFVAYTPGSGGKLHSATRTIGANTVDEEIMVLGEPYLPVYTVTAPGVASTTANSHLIEVMAGSSANLRIRKIILTQFAGGAVSAMELQILRLTTAGTGGTPITPNALRGADPAAGATAMTLPSAKGTEGVVLWQEAIWLGALATPSPTNNLRWFQDLQSQPIVIATGTSNGFAIKNTNAVATSSFDITIQFVETAWL